MIRKEAIEFACTTTALAYHSIGDFSLPSDGFCHRCDKYNASNYQNAGIAARFVRDAVVEKLKRDGYKIDKWFDPETGDEVTK